MAKINSIISFIGRAGNVVGAKGPKGQTILRPYQPVVANPQTPAQLMQRAKVNLAGQLSGITPAGAITPLGMGSKANNRSEFLKNLIKAATVVMNAEGYRASIPARNIIFSHGTQPALATMTSPTVSASAVTASLSLRAANADMAGLYGERIVVIIANAEVNQRFDQVLYKDVILTDTSATSVTIDIPVTLTESKDLFIYRIPFVLSESGRSLLTGNMTGNENDVTALLAVQQTAIGDWGETIYVTSAVFTAQG